MPLMLKKSNNSIVFSRNGTSYAKTQSRPLARAENKVRLVRNVVHVKTEQSG